MHQGVAFVPTLFLSKPFSASGELRFLVVDKVAKSRDAQISGAFLFYNGCFYGVHINFT